MTADDTREALDKADHDIAALTRWDKRSVPGGFHVPLSGVLAVMSDLRAALAAARRDPEPYRCGGPQTGQPRPHTACNCTPRRDPESVASADDLREAIARLAVGDPEYPLHRVLAIEAAIRGTEARASLDVVAVAKAFRVIADIDYPVDWSNWLGGEGTASAALAGLQTAEAFIARYRAIIEAER